MWHHLCMKQGSLFCFVLSRWDLLNHVFHVGLLVSLESSWWVWAQTWVWDCLELRCIYKLLTIEPFSQWKWNKIEIKKMYWNLEAFLVLLKSPRWVRSSWVYFTIFRAKVWKILIREWILLLKIQKNCKNWVWKEKSGKPSMCSHLGQWHRLH
jgi:hypothetical protein